MSLTYGKQYIRHANTYLAGASAVEAFTVVELSSGTAVTSDGGECLGIAQHSVPTDSADPAMSRLLSVAQSGDLIVECVNTTAYNGIAVGSALQVNSAGKAINTGGTAVTMNGSTPIVVEKLKQGGLNQILVRFL